MIHFTRTGSRILVDLAEPERVLLGQVIPLLESVGETEDDPGKRRLDFPVYLDSPVDDLEWKDHMGAGLAAGRMADRHVFSTVVDDDGPVEVSFEGADSLVRVLNEARLVYAARQGIDVASDFDNLDEGARIVLDYLGALQEELTLLLMSSLDETE